MLIEKARELGVMIADSQEFQDFAAAKRAVTENEALTGLLNEYAEKRERLVASLSSDEGDSREAIPLTNDIERLREQLNENPTFSKMMKSEAAFSALLEAINNEINACIGQTADGCPHDCASCGGCAH